MKKIEMCRLIKTRSGKKSIMMKLADEKPFHLHSSIDPIKEADEWQSQILKEDHTAYIILGCGLGYHVRTFWDNLPESSIVFVFLTETEVHLINQTEGPLDNLDSKRLLWINNCEVYDIVYAISQMMIEFNIKKIKICQYFPAVRINADFYTLCNKKLINWVGQRMAFRINVSLNSGKRFIENFWCNVPHIAATPGISAFKNLFRGWPFIVVAGGPSLDKNIDILKECLPYAVIIAAGSTMGALHRQGIQPHFLAVSDPNPDMFDALDGCCNAQTILLAPFEVYHEVVETYPGRCCFAITDDDINIGLDSLSDTELLKQTSSVATMAIDFARYCGAEKIIMVGQDLAYAGNHHHANGVKAGGFANSECIEVPGYYGGTVPTVYAFKIVIEYLEAYIPFHSNNSNIRFINSTEGGAKIEGAEQLSLAEVKSAFLETVLPIKEKINGIYETYRLTPLKSTALITEIANCQQHCCHIIQLLEKYEQEHLDFKRINKEEGRAILTIKIQNLQNLFDQIKNHSFAPLYKTFLNPRLQKVQYYRQDDMHIADIYELHVKLFNEFQQFIKQLNQWIQKASSILEGTGDGSDIPKL